MGRKGPWRGPLHGDSEVARPGGETVPQLWHVGGLGQWRIVCVGHWQGMRERDLMDWGSDDSRDESGGGGVSWMVAGDSDAGGAPGLGWDGRSLSRWQGERVEGWADANNAMQSRQR